MRIPMAGAALGALATLLLLVGACGGSEPVTVATTPGTASSSPTLAPSPAPEPTQSLMPEPMPPIVAAMLQRIAAGRNLAAPDHIEASLISRDELPAVLESAFTDDDRRWFAETTVLYRLLGYIGAGEDYYDIYLRFASEAVIGLYDTLTRKLFVVADGGRDWDALSAGQRETLAHEVVHALQDYHFDLGSVIQQTLGDRDQNLAYLAVVEGDAVTHETLADDRRGLVPAGRFLALADFARATAIPVPIERELRFPYTTGADWVRGLAGEQGTTAIDDLLREPPATTAVVLHPERGVRWQPDRPELPDLSGALGAGWERSEGGGFGEFHWMNLLQTRLRGLDAALAAAAWAGDRHDLYADGDQAVAVFRVRAGERLGEAVTRWLGEGAETGRAITLSGGRTGFFATVPDGFVLVIGTDEGAARRAMEALLAG